MFTQEQVEKLIALANKLDEQGLHKEADRIDGMIKEAGVGDWLKRVWNAVKGNEELQGQYAKIFQDMQKTTLGLQDAIAEVNGAVETMVKLVGGGPDKKAAVNFQNMAKWADFVKTLKEKITVSLQNVKGALAAYQQFEAKGAEVAGTKVPAGAAADIYEEGKTPAKEPGLSKAEQKMVAAWKAEGVSEAKIKKLLDVYREKEAGAAPAATPAPAAPAAAGGAAPGTAA